MPRIHVDRRQFIQLSGAALAASALPVTCWSQERDKISISANGALKVKGWFDEWSIDPGHIKIDGLTIPQFTWSWVAFNLASGVVAGIGGMIFNALAKNLGPKGPSMQELLNGQLKAIEKLVDQELREQDLRECEALLTATTRTMQEYNRAPSIDRLNNATNDSQHLLAKLEGLDYPAYQMFMIAASLRLAIIQERAHADMNEIKVFDDARNLYASYHQEMDKQIQTDLSLVAAAAPHFERYKKSIKKPPKTTEQILKFAVNHPIFRDRMIISEPLYGVDPSAFPKKSVEEITKLFLASDLSAWNRNRAISGSSTVFSNSFDPHLKARSRLASKRPHIAVVDWESFIKEVRNESTVPGQKIVEKWKKAKAA